MAEHTGRPLEILITAINYAPETNGSAPYTSQLAEHWARRHRVTVVAGIPHYPSWKAAAGYGRLWSEEVLEGVKILRRRHYVPSSQSALRRAAYELTFIANGVLASASSPDVVVGVVPSLSSGMLARLAAARWGAPYALIFQDLMGAGAAQTGIAGGGRVASLVARGEAWAAARAARVAVVSEAFRPYLVERGVRNDRIEVLRNWTHVLAASTDRPTTRARMGWSTDETVVLHAGNMGMKQGLDQVVAAARLVSRKALPIRFVLMGDGNQRARLEMSATGVPAISFLPFQSEEDLPNVLAAADVLLVSERETVRDMSLPSKLTSYLTAGRPIVAAVRPDGATAAEVRRTGAGVVVGSADPAALLDAVADLSARPDAAEALGEAGRAYAAKHLDRASALRRADEFLARTMRCRSADGRNDR